MGEPGKEAPKMGYLNCEVCGEKVPVPDVVAHLTAHGYLVEVQNWPDGQPVVEDHTLTPADFTIEQQ